MLTKAHKTRLERICKVLFPKYKYVSIDKRKKEVTFKNYRFFLFALFMPKLVYSFDELIQYRIPIQLSDFLYGNTDFVSVIQENLVKCELSNQNKIDYFYDEVSKVKYADIYKQMNVDPEFVPVTPVPELEDEMWRELIKYESNKISERGLVRLYKSLLNCDKEAVFYTFLAIMVLCSILF